MAEVKVPRFMISAPGSAAADNYRLRPAEGADGKRAVCGSLQIRT
mgnify:CR=1 FL=1